MMRTLIVLTALIVIAAPAVAGVESGDVLLTGNVSYVFGTTDVTDESVDGTGFGFMIEQLAGDANFSFGFAMAYASKSDETIQLNETIRRTITTWPIYFGCKYWHGNGDFQLYIGAFLGAYFSTLETTNVTTGEPSSKISIDGAGLGVPVGFAFSFTRRFFLNTNYTLNWLWDDTFLKNNILSAVNVGLGINFGG